MSEHEKPTKSGQQIGAEYAGRLRSYLDDLRTKRQHLPTRNGKLDKSAVAHACEFPRLTLYQNREVSELLAEAAKDKDIGVINGGTSNPDADGGDSVPKGRTAHLEKQISRYERRIGELEEIRATQAAEIEELKRERRGLRERLRQYEVMEEIMTTGGRRFRP